MLTGLLESYRARSPEEELDVTRVRELVARGDPWSRSVPLHVTGSALVVHVPSRRVLLRWHDRMGSWLQVGGHADSGEDDPFAIALREAGEETCLSDLVAWPDAARPWPVQIVVVPVPAGKGELAHEHADVRYVLATDVPDAAVPESEAARLAWLGVDDARAQVAEENLRVCLARVARLLA